MLLCDVTSLILMSFAIALYFGVVVDLQLHIFVGQKSHLLDIVCMFRLVKDIQYALHSLFWAGCVQVLVSLVSIV